jgi:hypothetical protein
MTQTLSELRVEIPQQAYDAAVDSLAQITAWELSVHPGLYPKTHTLEVASSLLLAVALASDDGPDEWYETIADKLNLAGLETEQADKVADKMTTPMALRRALSLSNVLEDSPRFGLRIFHRYRDMDIPRFIYSAIKLSS